MSDDRLANDLVRLTDRPKTRDPLAGAGAPTPLASKTGRGSLPASASSTAGIASPLTEADYSKRTFHTTPATVTSSDGLFTFTVQRLKSLEMTDAKGALVKLVFAEPA